jgi:hypothetical protein
MWRNVQLVMGDYENARALLRGQFMSDLDILVEKVANHNFRIIVTRIIFFRRPLQFVYCCNSIQNEPLRLTSTSLFCLHLVKSNFERPRNSNSGLEKKIHVIFSE